jgi:GT2 family glycosyltransferase
VNPSVSIVVLNWNGKDDTLECLESLCRVTYSNYDVVLVDNGSTDGSVPSFRQRFPHLQILETGTNLGFAAGNNIGIRWGLERGADYVLLLNNDTVVSPDFLEELVRIAEGNRRIGFVGPKIYYYNYHRRKDVIAFAGGQFRIWRGRLVQVGAGEVDRGQYDVVREVDYVEGSCLLARVEMIRTVGLLDPDYFMYWEDTDWCIRAAKAGYKAVYVPAARIWHKEPPRATGKSSAAYYYFGRNVIRLVKRHATLRQLLRFAFSFFGLEMWRTLFVSFALHRSLAQPRAYLGGIIDGLRPQGRNRT